MNAPQIFFTIEEPTPNRGKVSWGFSKIPFDASDDLIAQLCDTTNRAINQSRQAISPNSEPINVAPASRSEIAQIRREPIMDAGALYDEAPEAPTEFTRGRESNQAAADEPKGQDQTESRPLVDLELVTEPPTAPIFSGHPDGCFCEECCDPFEEGFNAEAFHNQPHKEGCFCMKCNPVPQACVVCGSVRASDDPFYFLCDGALHCPDCLPGRAIDKAGLEHQGVYDAKEEQANAKEEHADVKEEQAIPNESDILTHATVFGLKVPLPGLDDAKLPITQDVTDESAGQLKALNTLLSLRGMGDKQTRDRHYSCWAILKEALGGLSRVEVPITLKDLSKYEAGICLSFLADCDDLQAQKCLEVARDLKPATIKTGTLPLTVAPTPEPEPEPAEIVLSPEQEAAITAALTLTGGEALMITGNAGTGKSVTIREIRERTSCIVVAPTGIAAINVNGGTIHRTFGIKTGPVTQSKCHGPRSEERQEAIRQAAVILIDEISMCRADLLDGINWTLQSLMKNKLPFGGKPVILVGDLAQIEPVVGNEEKPWFEANYKSPFFFDAHIFENMNLIDGENCPLHVHYLTKVFRQTGDNVFIEALNHLRSGNPLGLEVINRRAGIKPPLEVPTLTFSNSGASAINNRSLAALPGDSEIYKATITGEIDAKNIIVEETIELKVGARVMIAKNTQDEWGGFVANGSMGAVAELGDEPKILLDNGRHIKLTPNVWEAMGHEFDLEANKLTETVVGTFTQIPIKLAWAITVHKSQGQTLERASLNFENRAFAHGQVYVAVSRVRSLDGVYLSRRLTPEDIIIAPRVTEWMTQKLTKKEAA